MVVIKYDKDNKQTEYVYMAEDFDGNTHVGYIHVDKPWYSSENQWKYYIRYNDYSHVGNIGNDPGGSFVDVIVDKSTIRPCTQSNRILGYLKDGNEVLLEDDSGNEIIILKPGDELPDLWK